MSSLQTAPVSTEVLFRLYRTMQVIRQTEEELARCQTRLKAGRRMGLQTNGARAMHAGLNTLYGLPADDAATYDAHIDAVTITDLQAFARRHFQRNLRTQLVVRP